MFCINFFIPRGIRGTLSLGSEHSPPLTIYLVINLVNNLALVENKILLPDFLNPVKFKKAPAPEDIIKLKYCKE